MRTRPSARTAASAAIGRYGGGGIVVLWLQRAGRLPPETLMLADGAHDGDALKASCIVHSDGNESLRAGEAHLRGVDPVGFWGAGS